MFHGIIEAGGELLRSSSPTLKFKELKQLAQDCVQTAFEYLQRRRLHNLPRKPVTVFDHPHSTRVCSSVQMELHVF